MATLERPLRRAYAHLTRTRARGGWTLTALCFLAYLAADGNEPLEQLALVIMGVAAGAIFLPEMSDSLWHLTPNQVRSTIPDKAVQDLQSTLVESRLGDAETANLVMTGAIEPLLQAALVAGRLRWDPKYDITVNRSRIVAGGSSYTKVETLTRDRRRLPPAWPRRYWFSATRTPKALDQEFRQPACVARELMQVPEVPNDQWASFIIEQSIVSVQVNGIPLVCAASLVPGAEIVRWVFEIPDSVPADGEVGFTFRFDFPISNAEREFPVMFSQYYTLGTLGVSFRAFDQAGEPLSLRATPFMAAGIRETPSIYVDEPIDRASRFVLSSRPDSVIWPGSGIYFAWEDH